MSSADVLLEKSFISRESEGEKLTPLSRGAPGALLTTTLWFDTKAYESPSDRDSLILRAINGPYTGLILYGQNIEAFKELARKNLKIILHVESEDELIQLRNKESLQGLLGYLVENELLVIASTKKQVLSEVTDLPTCLRVSVDDASSLHESIEFGKSHPYVAIRFRDSTNIPLELVIASLQASRTTVIKEISSPCDVDDAIVSLGVMEHGADGVAFAPEDHGVLDQFIKRVEAKTLSKVEIEVATVVRTQAIGMGYRSCIDVATLFGPEEGMLIGSTSQGGVLCCPEVFFLPYMELGPFRVNAGAVHSYVYNFGNHTDYMTELRAGSNVMIVGADGTTRRAAVGRMKTEVRPLRLIEASFASGETINVIMQDDWHVRIFSADRKPLNITELKPGDRILAHKANPGRHVGIKIEENILES